MPLKNEKVCIIGSGLIGKSWAMLFAAAGYNVCLYDTDISQAHSALSYIKDALIELEKESLLRGDLSVNEQMELISVSKCFPDCLKGAVYIQECVPENLEMKKEIFSLIDQVVDDTTILASSTSSIPGSRFSKDISHRSQVIVAHPVNPPFYCPATEIVPTPWTTPYILEKTLSIMKELGQTSVLVKKEVDGFVLNRLQYALLNECWRLVQDDVISVEDIDKVVTEGLGMRYAFVGPLETCHLNAEGLKSYCERYGDMIYRISSQFGDPPKLSENDAKDDIIEAMNARVPLQSLAERREWRDKRLIELAKLKKNMSN